MKLAATLLLLLSASMSQAAIICDFADKDGVVVTGVMQIESERGSPIASGTLTMGDVTLQFESGWAGYTQETGGTQKSVFTTMRVRSGQVFEGSKDLQEGALLFSMDLHSSKNFKDVMCNL